MKLFSITSLPTQAMILRTSITIPVVPTIQVKTIQYRTLSKDHLLMQLITMVVEVTLTMRGRLTMHLLIVGTLKEIVTCLRTFHFMTLLWKRMRSWLRSRDAASRLDSCQIICMQLIQQLMLGSNNTILLAFRLICNNGCTVLVS
jgi:hypothetical protein